MDMPLMLSSFSLPHSVVSIVLCWRFISMMVFSFRVNDFIHC